jgi:hypothetical protein
MHKQHTKQPNVKVKLCAGSLVLQQLLVRNLLTPLPDGVTSWMLLLGNRSHHMQHRAACQLLP